MNYVEACTLDLSLCAKGMLALIKIWSGLGIEFINSHISVLLGRI